MFLGWHISQLRLTSPHNQVSLTINVAHREWYPPTWVGRHQVTPVSSTQCPFTRMKWDTLLAMHTRAKSSQTSLAASQTKPLVGQRPRPHIQRRDKQGRMGKHGKRWAGAPPGARQIQTGGPGHVKGNKCQFTVNFLYVLKSSIKFW